MKAMEILLLYWKTPLKFFLFAIDRDSPIYLPILLHFLEIPVLDFPTWTSLSETNLHGKEI